MGRSYSPSKARHPSLSRKAHISSTLSPVEAFNSWESRLEPTNDEVEEVKNLQEEIRSNLKEILALDSETPDFLFGSYKQRTAISQIDDVDIIVTLDSNQYGFLAENKPDLAIKFLARKLKEIYGTAAEIETYDN